MIRALLVTCGVIAAVPLALAVRHDPHAWWHLLTEASSRARHLADALDARITGGKRS